MILVSSLAYWAASSSPTLADSRQVEFRTASGLVTCAIQPTLAMCNIGEDGVTVNRSGLVQFSDGGAFSDIPPARSIHHVIHRGQLIRVHGFKCYANRTRIRCTVTKTGKGMFVEYRGAIGEL